MWIGTWMGRQYVAMSKYSQWYAKPRWREKRTRQLQRQPLCVFCERMGRTTPATIADHIEPHRGDLHKFWHGDLMSLCATCHSSVKQRMENGKAVVQVGLDGWPIE